MSDERIEAPFGGFLGRKGLYSIPGVVEFVENLLYTCSMAQERRRTNEIKTVGISMPDLKDHIFANFPSVREQFPHLGNCTVRRYLLILSLPLLVLYLGWEFLPINIDLMLSNTIIVSSL